MSKLYSNIALMKLASIQSQYAYREMLSFMLTSEDRKERYKYAVKLMMAYPHNGSSIYSYAMELNDDRLIQTLNDVAKKFNIQTEISEKYKESRLYRKGLHSKNPFRFFRPGYSTLFTITPSFP